MSARSRSEPNARQAPELKKRRWGMAYVSRRKLVFTAAYAWAVLLGSIITAIANHVLPGTWYILAVPIELSSVATAALVANRRVRKQDEERLNSGSLLDQEELLQEEMEQVWANLDQVGLPQDRIAEEKLLVLHRFQVRRAQLQRCARKKHTTWPKRLPKDYHPTKSGSRAES